MHVFRELHVDIYFQTNSPQGEFEALEQYLFSLTSECPTVQIPVLDEAAKPKMPEQMLSW